MKLYVTTRKDSCGSGGGTVVEEGKNYTSKALELSVQTGKGTNAQWEQIGKAIEYALDKNIKMTIKFID